MGTIWGYHYAGGGFDCSLILDYSSEEHPEGNYSTVTWAIRITGYFPGYVNWIMGNWSMSMGNWASSDSGRINIGGIDGGNTTKTLDSGSFNIGHGSDGRSVIPINFNSSLYYYDIDSESTVWSLPTIDRNYTNLDFYAIKEGTSSITFRFYNNYPCKFVFPDTNKMYYINESNSQKDITISGLNPNTEYGFGTHGVWNLNNNVPTPNDRNPYHVYHTNGYAYLKTDFNSLNIIAKQTSIEINNIPEVIYAATTAEWQYSLDNGGSWATLKGNTISGLKYHTNYTLKLRFNGKYYQNNTLVNFNPAIESSAKSITTKYNTPIAKASIDMSTTGTQLNISVNPDTSVAGTQTSGTYKYRINLYDNGVLKETKEISSFTYNGLENHTYKISATIIDEDGTPSSPAIDSVKCISNIPTVKTLPTLVPYMETLQYSNLVCNFINDGIITIKLLRGNIVVSTKDYSAAVGLNSKSDNFDGLQENQDYLFRVELQDKYKNSLSSKDILFHTYPKVPILIQQEDKNFISLIGDPTTTSFRVKWNPYIDGAGNLYSIKLTYNIILKKEDGTILKNLSDQLITDYLFTDLTPETKYFVEITPSNGYTYHSEDITFYPYKSAIITTAADMWLKIHLDSDSTDVFKKCKVYLINDSYPQGKEIKKAGIKLIH